MSQKWSRRSTIIAAMSVLPAVALAAPRTQSEFVALERRYGGRLGVAALDTGTGKRLAHRTNERFPMCSTFKLIAVSAVLARVDRGEEKLGRRIAYGPRDLLAWAPVTRAHIHDGGMTVGALCAAAIEYSDNTAANLLLASLGGPMAVTRFARSLGDKITRLDRTEPTLNTCIPGDPRDTTTPAAMLADLDQLVLGRVLSDTAQKLLTGWMAQCQTAATRIPAGLPARWKSENKTGTGEYGTVNDVAILWPPKRAPILVAAYYTGSKASNAQRDAVLAEVGRVVAAAL